MARVRSADDFAAIRSRVEELRRERQWAARRAALEVDDTPDERPRIADELRARAISRKN